MVPFQVWELFHGAVDDFQSFLNFLFCNNKWRGETNYILVCRFGLEVISIPVVLQNGYFSELRLPINPYLSLADTDPTHCGPLFWSRQ